VIHFSGCIESGGYADGEVEYRNAHPKAKGTYRVEDIYHTKLGVTHSVCTVDPCFQKDNIDNQAGSQCRKSVRAELVAS